MDLYTILNMFVCFLKFVFVLNFSIFASWRSKFTLAEKKIETVPVRGFCSPKFSIISVVKTTEKCRHENEISKANEKV
jgi:hypothetical protein